jgi:hypothetical protein
MEMAVLGGDDDGEVEDLAYELLGVVVFERTGLEECRGSLWGFGQSLGGIVSNADMLNSGRTLWSGRWRLRGQTGWRSLLGTEVVLAGELRQMKRRRMLGT